MCCDSATRGPRDSRAFVIWTQIDLICAEIDTAEPQATPGEATQEPLSPTERRAAFHVVADTS